MDRRSNFKNVWKDGHPIPMLLNIEITYTYMRRFGIINMIFTELSIHRKWNRIYCIVPIN